LAQQCGISRSDFWQMSWFEFNCAVDGLNESRKTLYDVMRRGASLVMSPHVSRSDVHKIKPERLFPMPDDEIEHVPIERDEAEQWIEFFTRKIIDQSEIN